MVVDESSEGHESSKNSPIADTEMDTDAQSAEVHSDQEMKDDPEDSPKLEQRDQEAKDDMKTDDIDESLEEADNGGSDTDRKEEISEVDPVFDEALLKPIFERRDKSLKELLDAMDEYSPIIPDAVTDYYLTKSGFRSSDVRIKRLLALATQKFVADIANDAYQYSRIRAQSGNTTGGAARARPGPGSNSGRTVLTMESLSGVLEDYGVNAKRPDFFR